MNVLEEAGNLIDGNRAQNYGDVSENFERIAKMWGAYRGQFFDRHDVAQMMILVKVARQAGGYHRDSNVDIAGYAALAEKVHNQLQTEDMEREIDRLTQPESLWVIYVEDVPEEDQFFIEHMEAPLQPRVWESLTEVTCGLTVTDPEGIPWVGEGPGGATDFDKYGPFTEVIGNE